MDIAQLGLGFFSLFGAVYFLKKLIKGQKENKKIQKENVYSVSTILKEYKNLLKNNKKKMKICIKGELISKRPFKDYFNQKNVLFTKLNKYNLYQNESFYNTPIYSLIKSNQYISIQDFFEKEKKIPIFMDLSNYLESISKKNRKDKFFLKENNLFQNILQIFWKIIMLTQSGIFGFNIFKGFNIGVRESEFTVDLFTPVFIYGNIYLNENNMEISIKSVKYFKRNLSEIQNLVNIKNFWYFFGYLFFTFGAGYLIFKNFRSVFLKIKNNIRENFKKSFLENSLLRKKNKNNTNKIYCSSPNCILCKKKSREILFKPCNDFLYCEDCYNRYKKINQLKNCPICNVRIKKEIKFHQV